MGFGLIPVRHKKEVIGAMIAVAMFDGGLERPGERDRRIQMEPV